MGSWRVERVEGRLDSAAVSAAASWSWGVGVVASSDAWDEDAGRDHQDDMEGEQGGTNQTGQLSV